MPMIKVTLPSGDVQVQTWRLTVPGQRTITFYDPQVALRTWANAGKGAKLVAEMITRHVDGTRSYHGEGTVILATMPKEV